MARDPLVFDFLPTLLQRCMVSLMRTRLLTHMIVPQRGFSYFPWTNLISWSSTKQRTVARSSTKDKYCAIAIAAAKLQWVNLLLSELLVPVCLLPTLFSNNFGATFLSVNPILYSRIKHLAIDYHLVHDLIQ